MNATDTPARRRHLAGLLLTLALVPGVGPFAQTARGGGSTSPEARVQAVMQQVAAEKASLQAEIERLKAQVADLGKKVTKLQADNQSLSGNLQRGEGELAAARTARERMTENAQAADERMKELVAKYRELADNLRKVESERNGIAGELKARQQDVITCSKDNVEIAGLAGEALDRYEKKGCFGALAQSEPFTQIGRSRVQNTVETYRQKVDALKVPGPSAQ
jgi:chaperonin cofactor prefoldin